MWAEALAGTGAKGRSCEIARLLGYEPEAGHSCRYRGRAAGRFGAVASAGASALRRRMCPPSCIDISDFSVCTHISTHKTAKKRKERKAPKICLARDNSLNLFIFSRLGPVHTPTPRGGGAGDGLQFSSACCCGKLALWFLGQLLSSRGSCH